MTSNEQHEQDFFFKSLFVPLTTFKAIHIIVIVGFIVFGNVLFNGFVWDDIPFIIQNSEMRSFDLTKLFGTSIFNSGSFYRPIPAVYFTSLYSFFGEQAFFYHALQLTLHLICTSLLFLFFCRFFTNGISFFLALLFLVHPINVESVAFIGATQSQLYFLPGISALLLAGKQNLSRNRLLLISIMLLVCVLTKETGFLFILLIIAYRYLFQLNKLKQVFLSLATIVPIYLIFRILIGGVTYSTTEFVPIATLSFWERILHIPAIIVYYLKTFVFPFQLVIWQQWIIKTVTLENFFIPLLISSLLFLFFLWMAKVLYKKAAQQSAIPLEQFKDEIERDKHRVKVNNAWRKAKSFLFFLFWFVIGVGLILQLVPLDMTVADRWFYFPIVGLLGLIGIGLQSFWPFKEQNKKLFITVLVLILCLFSIRTFIRTMDWKDMITLYKHDVMGRSDNPRLINNLASRLYFEGQLDEAQYYAKQSHSLSPSMGSLRILGMVYQTKKQYNDAIVAYTSAIALYNSKPITNLEQLKGSGLVKPEDGYLREVYVSLANTYILAERPHDAIKLINENGLKKFSSEPRLYYYLAYAEYKINDHKKAFEAITKSYQLDPNKNTEYIYVRLKNNLPLD